MLTKIYFHKYIVFHITNTLKNKNTRGEQH